jgi:hypothetical protein
MTPRKKKGKIIITPGQAIRTAVAGTNDHGAATIGSLELSGPPKLYLSNLVSYKDRSNNEYKLTERHIRDFFAAQIQASGAITGIDWKYIDGDFDEEFTGR